MGQRAVSYALCSLRDKGTARFVTNPFRAPEVRYSYHGFSKATSRCACLMGYRVT